MHNILPLPVRDVAAEVRFTSPPWGEVGWRSHPGEGFAVSMWSKTPHPRFARPLPMGEVKKALCTAGATADGRGVEGGRARHSHAGITVCSYPLSGKNTAPPLGRGMGSCRMATLTRRRQRGGGFAGEKP